MNRCAWCESAPDLFNPYHDTEWGFPVDDDTRLFEKIVLEGFQSGLSWRTILAKREHFREAFHGFELDRVARFGSRDRTRLLKNAGIVRHRGKIDATINNAARAREMIDECGSIGAFVWTFEPGAEERPETVTDDYLRSTASTPSSTALSKALKKRGWTFVGPTTCYAFMQAMGLVNDHVEGCGIRAGAARVRRGFSPPTLAG